MVLFVSRKKRGGRGRGRRIELPIVALTSCCAPHGIRSQLFFEAMLTAGEFRRGFLIRKENGAKTATLGVWTVIVVLHRQLDHSEKVR